MQAPYLDLLGEGERDEEELRDEDDLDEAERDRRLGGSVFTMASEEVSCPAIFISFAYIITRQ